MQLIDKRQRRSVYTDFEDLIGAEADVLLPGLAVGSDYTRFLVVEPARLYESPFTDLTPHGPDGLFSTDEVDQLIAVINGVRDSAVAA